MACFVVPAAEAVVTTVAAHVLKNKESKCEVQNLPAEEHMTWSSHVRKLSNFLWGGSALLAFEHVWHGEATMFFPFLTAAKSPETLSVMFHEMSTVGVTMAVVVTAFWGALTLIETKVSAKADDKKLIREKVR